MRLMQPTQKAARMISNVLRKKMMEEIIRRDVFEVVELNEADDSDYWLDRSPIKRIEAIEFMRKVMYGHDRVSERLQRVCFENRLIADLGTFKVNFISKDDLLTNKRASGRPQDLVDFDKLQNKA